MQVKEVDLSEVSWTTLSTGRSQSKASSWWERVVHESRGRGMIGVSLLGFQVPPRRLASYKKNPQPT